MELFLSSVGALDQHHAHPPLHKMMLFIMLIFLRTPDDVLPLPLPKPTASLLLDVIFGSTFDSLSNTFLAILASTQCSFHNFVDQ